MACSYSTGYGIFWNGIDHSHLVLIYRRSERVGPFTRICRPDRTENEACHGQKCQQMQICGTRVKENFRKYNLSERVSCYMRKIFLTYICNKTIKFTINDSSMRPVT